MAALWSDDPMIEGDELKHDQEELSPCCNAPVRMHWPCDTRSQCSNCEHCEVCGDPSSEEEMPHRHTAGRRRYR
jgi:hypothetical protein